MRRILVSVTACLMGDPPPERSALRRTCTPEESASGAGEGSFWSESQKQIPVDRYLTLREAGVNLAALGMAARDRYRRKRIIKGRGPGFTINSRLNTLGAGDD